ncbi:hypothetical protein J2X36_005320 [Methylobacterium sp. BE186]|uniref:hypothetical protein n=1 Tax=Methylobacterium sp. BE186 TaxID=2817715 RepID=UPI00285DFDC0|nr:hypothetical protein [Methylobacterium sp. BE186]MDR7040537.1 hypothetical protein [Methylobacterium sp. BE186]
MQQFETTIERLGPMAAATLRASAVEPFEAFVAPGDVFRHPREVLTYPHLSRAEKRAILASWASDARAVESSPTLRCLSGCRAEPVPLHEVLAALQALDGTAATGATDTAPDRGAPKRSRLFPRVLTRRTPRSGTSGVQVLN